VGWGGVISTEAESTEKHNVWDPAP
jgi:hypothetical protein